MAIIVENPRAFVLFDDGRGWVLTVVAGARDVSLRLSEAEQAAVRADRAFVRRLAAEVTARPAQFAHRQLRTAVWPKPGER